MNESKLKKLWNKVRDQDDPTSRDIAEIKRLLNESWDSFANFELDDAANKIDQAITVIDGNDKISGLEKDAKNLDHYDEYLEDLKSQSEKAHKIQDNIDKVLKKDKLTIEELKRVIDHFGLPQTRDDHAPKVEEIRNNLMHKKLIIESKFPKKKKIELIITNFHARDNISYISLKDLEHHHDARINPTPGWFPVDEKSIPFILEALSEQELREHKNTAKGLILQLNNWVKQGLSHEDIMKRIHAEKPVIKTAHGEALVDNFLDEKGKMYVHLHLYPASLYIEAVVHALETAIEIQSAITDFPEILDKLDHPWEDTSVTQLLGEDISQLEGFDLNHESLTMKHVHALQTLQHLYKKGHATRVIKHHQPKNTDNHAANSDNYQKEDKKAA